MKYPIANITQQEAIDACRSMWPGYHLITNDQWMTIARNIEWVASNWSSWRIWDGGVFGGVSGWGLYNCDGFTGWNTETRTRATRTWPWADQICNNIRQHILTNGSVIWDFAWNVGTNVNINSPLVFNTIDTWDWIEWWTYDSWDMQKYWSALWLWTTNGMWWLQNLSGSLLIRWWTANSWNQNWIFALQTSDSSTSRQRGFRCAR